MIYEGHEQEKALFANTGLYDVDGHGAYPQSDRGLVEVTHQRTDMGKFRVPTLHNVAPTAPYMHDGSLPTLDAGLDHYVRGGRRSPNQDRRIRPLTLTDSERTDSLALLSSIT